MARIDPEQIAFDIDGVVADTMHLFIDILQVHFGIDTVRYEDITAYRLDRCLDLDAAILDGALKMILEGGYRPPLKAVPGAEEVLRRIGNATGRILLVTARPDATLIDGWTRDLLKDQHSQVTVVATGSYEAKTDVLLDRGVHWFVEDRLATCELLKASGIEPILFKQPWNRSANGFLQVASWRALAQQIAFS